MIWLVLLEHERHTEQVVTFGTEAEALHYADRGFDSGDEATHVLKVTEHGARSVHVKSFYGTWPDDDDLVD